MKRIASGEEAAVGELYDRFGALVFQSARQVLNSRAEADDAVQEVFVRLWKTADRFDPERAKLVTWVMLICRRHLIDRLRRRGARPDMGAGEGPALDQSPAAGVRESLEDAEVLRIRDRISELPDLQREVIERAYLQGFTLREVARQLDAPLGTIKSALSRGLARLRERLVDSDLPGAPRSDQGEA
ncbi:MAG: RNA polymerase sigma factor [Phycisphaerales bacterium]|jgi:RNA polymerase sigma-70 factor (ECF subfamily)